MTTRSVKMAGYLKVSVIIIIDDTNDRDQPIGSTLKGLVPCLERPIIIGPIGSFLEIETPNEPRFSISRTPSPIPEPHHKRDSVVPRSG